MTNYLGAGVGGDVAMANTAAEALSAAIRQRIVTGRYTGGERLTEEQLAADFKASRMTIREALRVLNADGFIDIRPYFGTFVRQLGSKDAADLLELHGAIESLAAGLAAERRSSDDLAELRSLIEQGRQAAAQGRTTESSALHGQFHRVLANASANNSLANLMTQMRYKVDWVYAMYVRRPARDSWDEHSQIVDAIERQDAELAAVIARTHVKHGEQAQPSTSDGD